MIVNAVLNYSATVTPRATTWRLGLTYTSEVLDRLLHMNYGEYDGGADGFGLAANYDLGGGAEVQFGYGFGRDGTGADSDSQWSLGVSQCRSNRFTDWIDNRFGRVFKDPPCFLFRHLDIGQRLRK